MKLIYLLGDERENINYNKFIGRTTKKKKGTTFIYNVDLFDTLAQKYIKQKVFLLVVEVSKKYITVKVV